MELNSPKKRDSNGEFKNPVGKFSASFNFFTLLPTFNGRTDFLRIDFAGDKAKSRRGFLQIESISDEKQRDFDAQKIVSRMELKAGNKLTFAMNVFDKVKNWTIFGKNAASTLYCLQYIIL